MKKRSIAFLLMLSMLFSMSVPAFAANDAEHVHNEEGWKCVENATRGCLNCVLAEHIHSDECYQAGDPVLKCSIADESHEHTSECYIDGSSMQICGLEEHQHVNPCYVWTYTWTCEEQFEQEEVATVYENHFMDRAAFGNLIKQKAGAPEDASIESTSLGIVTTSVGGNTSRETQLNESKGVKFYNQDTLIDFSGVYIQPSEVLAFNVGFTYWYWDGWLLKRVTATVVLTPNDFDYQVFEGFAEWWVKGSNPDLSTIEATFVYNDGTDNTEKNVTRETKRGTSAQKLAAPEYVREDYLFTKWFADPECTQVFDMNQELNDDVQIYAGWEEKKDNTPEVPDVPKHDSKVLFYINLTGSILNVGSLESKPVERFTGVLTDKLGISVDFAQWAKDYPTAFTTNGAANYNTIYGGEKSAGLVGQSSTSADEINAVFTRFLGGNVPEYTGDTSIMEQIKHEITSKNKKILTINKNTVSVDLINDEYYTPQWYVLKLDPSVNVWHIDGVLKETPKLNETFSVTYKWDATAPAAASKLLPYEGKSTLFAKNAEMKIEKLAQTTIEADGGTYTFQGWKNGNAPAVDFTLTENTELVGTWSFSKTPVDPDPDPAPDEFKVVYSWNGTAPATAKLPNDGQPKSFAKNETVVVDNGASYAPVVADGGTYTFQGWKIGDNAAADFAITKDTDIVGTWSFSKTPVDPDPDPDPAPDEFKVFYSWNGTAPATAKLPNDGQPKSFAKNETVTVDNGTSYTPVVADGGTYTFQGWKIGDNAAADFAITKDTDIVGTWSFRENTGTDDRGEDITDPDVPLTGGDTDKKDEDKKDNEIDLGDNETPLTNPPMLPETVETEIPVQDEKIPLANLPKTGGFTGSLIALVGAAAIGGGLMLKRKDEDK